MKINNIVDSFVKSINKNENDIEAYSGIEWIDKITNRLPTKFPPSFMSLISRYIFDDFEAGKIWFYANRGDGSEEELGQSIFRDEIISRVTINNGFIHFAKSSDGSYDPICFDIRKRKNNGEFHVVKLDHEVLLQFAKIKVKENICSSLLEYMELHLQKITS